MRTRLRVRPRVGIKRLTFSGVWSEALPRRSNAQPTILPHRRIHGHDRPSATRSGEHRLDECEGGPSTKRSAAPSRRDTNASARNDVSRQTVRAGIRDRPRPSNQWMLGLNEGYSHRRQCRRRLRLPPARHQIQWQVDWRCRCRGGYSQRVCERQDYAKTVGLTSRAVVVGDVNYCDLIVERRATLEATVQRISRECWDEGAVEQRSMISATPQTSA